jgi:uncharacterized protein
MSPLAHLAIRAIEAYQRRGGGKALLLVECQFEPTCSVYAREAIARFGLIRGGRLALARVRRCDGKLHGSPRPDPVPDRR